MAAGSNGFNTQFMRFPEDKMAVAVFANVNGPGADRIATLLARLYFREDVKQRQAYPAFRLKARREGALLMVQATNQPTGGARVAVRGGADGKVISLTLHQNGRSMPGPRASE
jgi:hypothetical protein